MVCSFTVRCLEHLFRHFRCIPMQMSSFAVSVFRNDPLSLKRCCSNAAKGKQRFSKNIFDFFFRCDVTEGHKRSCNYQLITSLKRSVAPNLLKFRQCEIVPRVVFRNCGEFYAFRWKVWMKFVFFLCQRRHMLKFAVAVVAFAVICLVIHFLIFNN